MNSEMRDMVQMEFTAGAISGVAGVTVSHPFDTVKTLIQNSREFNLKEVLRRIKATKDYKTYFRGLSMPLSSYTFVNALTFSTFKPVQNFLDPEGGSISATFLAGSAAGITQLFVTVPTELIKVKMQVTAIDKTTQNLSAIQSFRKIVASEGAFRGLFRGIVATAARDIPGWGIYFSSYYTSRDFFHDWLDLQYTASTFFAGGVAGIASWTFTLPMDTVKTRIQSGKNSRIRGVLRDFRNFGGGVLRMCYKGYGVVCVRAAIVNAATLCVYDAVIAHLSASRSQNNQD